MKWSGTNRPVLVIGYGNSLRRDDGAGLFLASALTEAWSKAGLPAIRITCHQLSPELADDIANSGAEIVLFADAAMVDAEINPKVVWSAVRSSELSPTLGHHLTPSAVMLYASELYAYQGKAWTISIPGFDFDHGEGLSLRCRELIDEFLGRSSEIWDELHESVDDAIPRRSQPRETL